LFSVGSDLAALASRRAALPATIKSWAADLHAAIARMIRMRAPVVVAVQGNVAGEAFRCRNGSTEGSQSLRFWRRCATLARSSRAGSSVFSEVR